VKGVVEPALKATTFPFSMKKFLKAIAAYLVDNQAGKSIALQVETQRGTHTMMPKWAAEWVVSRNSIGVFGYPTVEETEAMLHRAVMDHARQELKEKLQATAERIYRVANFAPEDRERPLTKMDEPGLKETLAALEELFSDGPSTPKT
jgi:hypothetical protein